MTLGFAQNVDGLAGVVCILLLLDCNDTEDGVGVLVVKGEMGNAVVLIVGNENSVSVPLDGWGRVSLNLALQVHVKLEGLAEPPTGYAQHWRKLNLKSSYLLVHQKDIILSCGHWTYLNVNVSSCPLSDDISGDAVVGPSVLLGHIGENEIVAFEDGGICR